MNKYDAGAEAVLSTQTDRSDSATLRDLAPVAGSTGESDVQRLADAWNDTRQDWADAEVALHQTFERQVAATPEAIALQCAGRSLSYRALNERANKLARHLRALGIGPDRRVGLCLRRDADMVAAMLAVLKAGGAYVPLDPSYPRERLDYMLRDSQPRVLLTQAGLAHAGLDLASGLDAGIQVVELDGAQRPWEVLSADDLDSDEVGLDSGRLAYVIYTSGSTGRPKGVMIEHGNAVNFIRWAGLAFSAEELRHTLFSTSLNFDLAVFECFAPLSRGGCVHLVDNILALDADSPVTLINTVPSALRAIANQGAVPAGVRVINVAGEPLKRGLVEEVFQSTGVASVCNLYGPSETTTYSTWVRMAREHGFDPTVGRPVANTTVHLLDEQGEPVAHGEIGEIFIGGAGVARGYLDQPELTRERFVADPFSAQPGARMYKTGDLGRWNQDGRLEYLGRNDHQVKIRGFRIELGEIEFRLLAQPGVAEALVIAREDVPGEKYLTAYVVGAAGADPDPQALRAALAQALPAYMVPGAWVALAALPLTPNGKIDRNALPAPEGSGLAQRAYAPPQGETETALAQIWSELLPAARIGRGDHFLELGGHSLLAVQLSSRVRQRLGVEIPMASLFAHPVLRDFAAAVAAQAPSAPSSALVAAPRPQTLPLSFAQQRLWFLARMGAQASTAYNLSYALDLRGPLDEAALQAALDRIVRRHEALRTRFELIDGQPVQRIDEAAGFALSRHDLNADRRSEAQAIEDWRRVERQTPFDLERGPPVRGRVLRVNPQRHVLLLTMHHIVSDGWSLDVLARELADLYRAYATHACELDADPLPALPVQYADYALWQRDWLSGEVQQKQLGFWREQLTGAPAFVALPTDKPRPPVQDYRGQSLAIEFDRDLTAALKALSQRHGTTLYMTLLAAWGAVVARLAGQDEVVIGTPVANRARVEVEPLIGFFVNTLALRLDFGDRPSVAQLLAQVRERALLAQSHQDLPFEQVVEALQPERSPAHSPIFQLMFAWQNVAQAGFELDGLELTALAAQDEDAKFDLTLELHEAQDRIVGTLNFASALFEPATIQRQLGYLEAMLRGMVGADAQPVDAIALVGEAERRQVLGEWNATERAYPQDACVHELFERHAALTPQATAIEYEGRSLSYQALDQAAQRLAQRLRAAGVQAEQRVALCLRRSPELVIAMLAVLKAGGAYVPLDPASPAERLRDLLGDCAPRVLLTRSDLAQNQDFSGDWTLIEVDAAQPAQDAPAAEAPLAAADADVSRLAYVIYTSGSTGRPNGVMVEHRHLLNLVGWHSERFPLAPGERSSSTAGVAFDACTWEVWPTLCQGATLALPPSATAGDPAALLTWWEAQDLQTSFLVTALADAALARGQSGRRGLRSLLTGGDRLSRLPSDDLPFELVNNYGPTETTVVATSGVVRHDDAVIHIGKPIANTKIYLLDRHRQPVPAGAAGEIYVGGAQVARGYLNRPELTNERFHDDPFASQPGARMYKTGDLGRWRADGTLEYLGRNDHQVKIRGLRIEPGEIEAQLAAQPGIREAAVLAREDVPGEVRLVAYVVAADEAQAEPSALRAALAQTLPDYMVPAAYVVLDALPLTANGKIDRRALPAPDGAAFAQRAYEPPQGEVETALARIWSELLQVDPVGRHDHFFELGGHSLLAVQLMERLRREGLQADIVTLFARPTLAALAQAVAAHRGAGEATVPANAIPAGCEAITPQMLPLVDLDPAQIARIVAAVPGGAANVQDLYPLAPLQEGILFHHLLQPEQDPYLLSITLGFEARASLDRFADALQQVIDRHDVLRSAVQWEGLDASVQVVWRRAQLQVDTLDPAALAAHGDDAEAALADCAGSQRIDLRQAPLMRGFAAFDPRGQRWLLRLVHHHLALDHTALEVMLQEIGLILDGRAAELAEPVPFRNFVAQARNGVSAQEHEAFFRRMLGDIDEPTAPFGLLQVHGGGDNADEAERLLPSALSQRLRQSARALGVSAASLFHWAWAQVLAKTTGREDVVFGTVLFGRLHGGAGTDRAMGLFINTLPLRVRLGEIGVGDGIRQTHAALSSLVGHEHASLALAQRCSAVPAGAPLFTSMLNYRHSADEKDPAQWVPGATLVSVKERSSYPVDLSVDDLGDDFKLTAQAVAPVEPARICAYMHNALAHLADALELAPQTASWRIDVLGEAERLEVLGASRPAFSGVAPDAACIHTLFERQAKAAPSAIALEHGDERLSYAELDRRAERLAAHLRALGVGRDERVAICLQRGADALVAILATLKAGGAYVPLDPAYPRERLDYMLGDSRPRVVLTQTALDVARDPGLAATVVDLDAAHRPWEESAEADIAPAGAGAGAEHLAYVIYTSGSTGQPKGVAVEHGPLSRRIQALTERYGFAASDRILQFASINFDVSIEEIMGALSVGATLVLRDARWQDGAAQFWRSCADARISIAELPTKFWQYASEDHAIALPESLRLVIIGSEAVEARAIAHWAARPGHRPRLFNAYGPTEAVITATLQEVESAQDVHIGRPVADIAVYLLDARGQPAPMGVAGEIHLGGAGLARGYLDRPQLTRERFVADPFAAQAGARMYKTGDLGRWLADGTLEYLGRNDGQVKIRGFRIELGEIEAQLVRQAGVREAVVLARADAPGELKLVAYVVAQIEAALDPQALRAALAQTLPDHMVPAAYVALDALPMTPNGKLDRRALPAPQSDAFAQRAYEAPQGHVETVLAKIWSELLRVEDIGRNDNFFELGGHSLLAVQLMERLRREGLHADIRALFAKPTLAVLAQAVQDAQRAGWHGVSVPANGIPAGCEAIVPQMLPLVRLDQAQVDRIVAAVPGGAANVQDIYPLAPLQDGILFHHLLQTRGDPYLLSTLLSFESRDGLDDFVQALQHVVDRHDVLRTAMLWDGLPEPVQVVWRRARLEVDTLEPDGGDAAARLAALADPRDARMDVRLAPLMRGTAVYDERSQRWLLLLLQHHLAMDHVAVELIYEEIGLIRTGRAHELPEPVPFRNFVAQTRLGVSVQEHEAFFRDMLGDVDEPTAPFAMLEVHGDGENVHEAESTLPRELSRRLRQQARSLGVSTASLFHWAWAQVLAKTAGREDVVFGTVLFGRLQGGAGADRAAGLFMNSLPMRVHLGELSVLDGIRRTHATLSGLVGHEHAPLALAQRCSALAANTPLFSSLLNYRHTAPAGDTAPAWSQGVQMLSVRERTNYSFTLSVDDLGEDFELRAQIEEPVEPQRVCGFMHNALAGLVEALEHAPHTPSWQIEVLDPAERERMLGAWNATERAWAQASVHQQFHAQAALTPDAPALHFEDRTLSYAELDAKADRLARYLIDAGVAPGARVGLYLSRSPELLVAVLGVLKTGAAYVPLEPKLPKERLAYMVQDAGIGWALLEAAGMDELPVQDVDVVLMDGAADDEDWLADYAQGELPDVAPNDIAYVMYTSGSTGQPKGVMVEHGGLSNYLAHAVESYLPNVAGSVVSSPLCFDATLTTLLPPLLAGKSVWLLPDDSHTQTLARLSERLFAAGEGWLFKITPAHLDALSYLQRDVAAGAAPHCIVVGGEQLPSATLQRWKGELLPNASFVNEYGPTETVVGCSVWTLSEAAQLTALAGSAATPIGQPIGNTRLYVLDAHRQLQPIGSIGELYIGGAGVARGYLNRDELTRERFIADPFGEGRLYKTGDLVRYLADGELEFLGRIDDQVKIRGFRIELGEIEAQLLRQPGVREAAVLAREDEPGDKRLVAYVVADGDAALDTHAVRDALAQQLPDYMVPAAYVTLAALPLTGNGKLDRRALPAPAGTSSMQRDYAAPQGPVETAIAGLWSEILQVARVGRNDSFFELGGQSLLVVRMISRLRQMFGFNVALSTVFAHPVLHDFAQVAAQAQAAALPALVPAARPDDMPLSFAQQRLWLAAQFGEDASAAYHMPVALRLRGRLDRPALQAALDRIMQRHEALRTRFEIVDDQPVQRIAAAAPFELVYQDLDLGPAEREAAIERCSGAEAREPFDLARGPLFRGRLLRLDDGDHVLLLTLHHIVSDGWSLGVLADELSALYRAYAVDALAPAADPLPPLPVQYADYALWQRRCLDAEAQEHLLRYWRAQLAGSPPLSALPTDHPRPPTKGFVGGMVHAQIPQATAAALNELAGRHSSTLFMVLMAAFNVVLSRYTGQNDLNVGTVVANRGRSEVEPLIGLFLDTQAIRTRLDPAQSFESLLQQVRATLIQAYLHQDLPFDRLLEDLKPVRRPGVPPLFQVMVQMQSVADPVVRLPELSIEDLPLTEHTVKFDLTLYVNERDGAIEVAYEYDAALFEPATIERLAARFERLLSAVAGAPHARIDELGLPEALPAGAGEIAARPQPQARQGLSPHQRQVWAEGADAAHQRLPLWLEFDGAVSADTVQTALNLIVARHDALRTRFAGDGDSVWQQVHAEAELPLERIDLEPGHTLLSRALAELERPLQPDRDSPVRAALLRDGERCAWLCLTVHALIADRRSLQLLSQEIVEACAAIDEGRVPVLPALPLSFGDHVHWQSTLDADALEPLRMYWTPQLRGHAQALELPSNRPRAALQGFSAGRHGFAIEAGLGERLRAFARDRAVAIDDVLLTGFTALLKRYGGHQELIVGTRADGRDRPGLQATVGALSNLLPLRTAVGAQDDFDTLLAEVARTRGRALQHADLPFGVLAAQFETERDAGRAALFDVVFEYDAQAGQTVASGAWAARPVETHLGQGRHDLQLCVFPHDDGLQARLVYNAELYDAWLVEQMMGHFVRLLDRMTAQPSTRIERVELLDEAERARLCDDFNATERAWPQTSVHQQFRAQAALTPDAPALHFEDRTLSYAELDAKADRLAHYLIEAGVAPGARVGIYLSRSPELLIAVLGVLKTGAAYVPLEPKLPKERLAYMVQDAGIGWALLEAAGMDELPVQDVDVVLMDGAADDEDWLADYAHGELPDVAPNDIAYVMYTSGSTGQPKGVMVEHGGLSNYLAHAVESYLPNVAGSVVSSPLCFDATLTTLLPPLLAGKPVWLLPDDSHTQTLARLSERLFAAGEGWLFKITPAHLDALSYLQRDVAAGAAPHCIVVGGEQLPSATLRRWKGELLPNASFVNEYGPTETVVGCSVWTLSEAAQLTALAGSAATPIGQPIGNTRLYVLDAHRQLQPIGSIGELYIGGAGVARGYLNRDELTRERFIADPFGEGRLYKTGDLVRYLADGELEFLGRIDDQVKIRGFRIELGEIEAQLLRQPGVREAAVLAREDEPGDKRLVAYVVADGDAALDTHAVRDALAQHLPDYMVPAAYVTLAALPLTGNGKLDRRALPAPDGVAFAQRDFEAPQGATEIMLAGIWSELLGLERVGRHDNFFELGGHSLLAVRLMASLRREALHIDIRALFAQPTLAGLAEAVAQARGQGSGDVAVPANGIVPGCEAIVPQMLPLIALDAAQIERIVAAVPGGAANVQDIYPLAPLQEGILFHHLLQTQGDAYLLSTTLAFDSRARLDAFVNALQQVVDRHDVLRTAVLWNGLAEPVQVVWRQARFEVSTPQLAAGDVAARLAELADPLLTRMDVNQAPLMRGYAAFDDAGERWLLQLLHHHLVLDHTALDVLLHEIGLILTDRADELAEPVPFRNFVAQARLGVSAQEHEAFFGRMLGDVEEPTAPFGMLKVRGEGEHVREAQQPLPRALSRRLRHQARSLGVSTASLFHWAWAQVLAKTTGRDDVVFGTVLFGRLQGGAGAERAMGLFINTLPIRVRLGELGVQDGVRQAHAALTGLLSHEHASLALAQRCSAMAASAPLFSAVMNYRHSVDDGADAQAPAWAQGVEVLSAVERTNHVPFIMAVDDLGEDFELKALVERPIDPQRVCEYMHNALEALAQALEQAPQTPSWQLEVLGEAERRQVLAQWNDTRQDWPHADGVVHALFERQVRATPQAIAVEQGGERLSYLELNQRANRMARHLLTLGVKPDDKVAICLQRSVEMVVAMLAVFKAGGAYVPLDPAYPQARLDYMLRDSRLRVLVTTAALQDQLPASPILWRTPVVDMTEAEQWQHLADDDLDPATLGLQPSHLAYVIYTSGSTGVPKGVMATHRGLCNLALAQIAGFGVERDSRVLQFASFSFDACISEVVMALLSGASLQLPPPGILAGAELADWLDAHRISHATLPPALLATLPADAALAQLRTLILAGEAASAAQVKRWAPGRRLINAYGPTEATVCASMHDCDAAADEAPPIGRPIANGRLYILDAHGLPVPVGVAGELHIAGVQVARGYLNNPQLTEERFLADPFAADADQRMYRSGDLARWRADGTIDFLGRNDHQVKIRGFRIELGEIEAKLLAQADVREALVLAREDASGDRQLVAYVADGADAELDPQVLRQALAQALPDYMVPAAWVVLHSLPLTPNGKVDRKALPLPLGAVPSQSAYEAPEGETETALAQIWSELLGIEDVGRQDHFFEIGGHSLLATRLISRVRSEWDIEISLMTVFSNARLCEFADAIVDCQLSQFDADDLESIAAEHKGLVQ